MLTQPSNNRSEQLFRLLVNRYQSRVIRFISLFVNDRLVCEELSSEVFISLWLRGCVLPDIADMEKYLFIVAKNKAIDWLRKEREETFDIDSLSIDAFHYTETTPESIYISKETASELNAAINELPHRTKQAFLLVREQNKTYKEAAEILSVSVKTIEKQLASAVQKLKEKLTGKK
ncbi:MAG: sigma-70 family RNA polymerase sigma factor [Dysgonamonadaceae bacterium]|jgi:RNA polymerase sigma-70 factor (ECF subfamily)|nr:sigma-70 family RNA polymerase sigma factor [Dysgonamonadaceae bacterium]